MKHDLTMAYSPCPNDTFMFHDVATNGFSRPDYTVTTHLHDVETLNQLALRATYDLTKVSFHTYLLIRENYKLLNAGAALGFGCGPLLVSKKPISAPELPRCRVAIPGELTTAHLLLRLWAPAIHQKLFVPYDQVMDKILDGSVDCGIIIHETRFVYQDAGLTRLMDLGEWWEQETGYPIPLGCIVARKNLGPSIITDLEDLIRNAIRHSLANPAGTARYVSDHAREISHAVQENHIKMFVNDFSLDLGETGYAAIARLEEMARKAGLIT